MDRPFACTLFSIKDDDYIIKSKNAYINFKMRHALSKTLQFLFAFSLLHIVSGVDIKAAPISTLLINAILALIIIVVLAFIDKDEYVVYSNVAQEELILEEIAKQGFTFFKTKGSKRLYIRRNGRMRKPIKIVRIDGRLMIYLPKKFVRHFHKFVG